ncbi:DUF4232 domain-containing protein [Streptomyces sp. cg35]|uniref:DUF4232 domain-containing protein n=1 Tax=Streptomyces sp. cg35 TaxID=3421650 RepID=UPI003D169F9F
MRARKLTLAALALTAGLSLTACQGSGDSAAGTNDSASASSSSSSSDGASDSGADSTSGSSSDKNATSTGDEGSGGGQINTGPCKTANLDFDSAHGMGEGTLMVSFKNTGDACSLKGFPGVDLKAANGGGSISAGRSGLAAPVVVLKNGEETRFTLHYPRNDSGGSGVNFTSMVVTPPNETHSKTLPVAVNLPVSDKADSSVTVDPVGTGKQ